MVPVEQLYLPLLAPDVALDDEGLPSKQAKILQARYGTALGQIWLAESVTNKDGAHYLAALDVRGSNAGRMNILSVCDEHSINGIFTSPPYADRRSSEKILPADYPHWFDLVQQMACAVLTSDGSFFVNIKEHTDDGQRSLYVYKLVIRMVEVWEWKWIDTQAWLRNSIPGNLGPRFKNYWEPIYHFSRTVNPKIRKENVLLHGTQMDGTTIYDGRDVRLTVDYQGVQGGKPTKLKSKIHEGALPSNVIEVHKGFRKNPGHGAVFPTRLPLFFVKAFSDKGDRWLDPFGGSGRTIEACEMAGRLGFYVDKDPVSLAIALQALVDLGLKVQKISDAIPH